MMLSSFMFIAWELLRRSKGDFAEYNVEEPVMPKIELKEKEK